MTTSTPSLEALELISKRFSKNNIIHALGGSGLLFALGIIKEVRDWDLTTEAPLEDVIKTLEGLKFKVVPNNELFKSHYLIKVTHDNTELDIIGHFTIQKSDGDFHAVPVKISGYWNNIPLADPKEWLLAYKLMGRDEKAKILESYLKTHSPLY